MPHKNRIKSMFVPISIPQNLVQVVHNILSSPPANLPIRYLGLPLTIKKPRKMDFQPMLQVIQRRMEGWKSNFLSYGGRVTLVKAVLSAIPIHFIQATKVPKEVIKHIDKMRISFLWRGNDSCKGISCLVNWPRICALRENGGMGVLDLVCQNEALLTKWLWRLHQDRDGIWASTLNRLYSITHTTQVIDRPGASFFIKDLSKLVPFFSCSVTVDSTTAELQWRWDGSGKFTCSSTHRVMHETGIKSQHHRILWKLKDPMKVRIFLWLLMDNKLLNQAVLTARGCEVLQGCALCGNGLLETRDHLWWKCSYTKRFWTG